MQNDPKLITMTEQEAAEVTGFTVKTLQARRWKRQPPKYLKIGRLVRYRLSDLQDFLDASTIEAREA